MRALLLFVASLLAQEIFAAPGLPAVKPDQPFCAQNQNLWIMLYRQRDPGDKTLYLNLQVELHGEIFRAGMICDRKAEGKLHCAVECDGGQAELLPTESNAHLIFVNQGIHVSGACDPVDKPVFWEPAPNGENAEALQAVPCPGV